MTVSRIFGILFLPPVQIFYSGRASGTLPSQGSLEQFGSRSDPSWTNQLQPDPETEKYAPNKSSRQVDCCAGR